jgi:hypothetical protein
MGCKGMGCKGMGCKGKSTMGYFNNNIRFILLFILMEFIYINGIYFFNL